MIKRLFLIFLITNLPSKTDFVDIILDGVKEDFHVLSLGDGLSYTFIGPRFGLDFTFTTIGFVAGLALPAVDMSTFLQSDTVLNYFDTIVAGEGVE